jgi:hypothetical protein
MLLVQCSVCGRRHLRGLRSIERLENTAAGIVVTVRCGLCGEPCRLITGGRPEPASPRRPAGGPPADQVRGDAPGREPAPPDLPVLAPGGKVASGR